jgi:NitT/TauT family transport system ATP-binding protein
MQQRVAIARAIAFQPRVMLMDEPFAAVDAQTRADLEDLVRTVWKQFGMTMLFVTHDIDEAVYLGERVVMLSASPTHVVEDLDIDLPADRDQLETRSESRFVELRTHVYARIQEAKNTSAA